jgi:hypothetical protein
VLGAVPMGAVVPAGSVPLGIEALGTVPEVAPTCPGTVPGAVVVAPGVPMVPGTVVWAEAALLTPNPNKAAKNKEEDFIIKQEK